MENTLQAIVTMVSLVNPLVCLAMFKNIEQVQDSATQKKHAARVSLTTLAILVATGLVGTAVLSVFGISLDAFSVTGGAVLIGIGAAMLRGHQTPTNSSPSSPGGLLRCQGSLACEAFSPARKRGGGRSGLSESF